MLRHGTGNYHTASYCKVYIILYLKKEKFVSNFFKYAQKYLIGFGTKSELSQ
jgi:hypothetical protein